MPMQERREKRHKIKTMLNGMMARRIREQYDTVNASLQTPLEIPFKIRRPDHDYGWLRASAPTSLIGTLSQHVGMKDNVKNYILQHMKLETFAQWRIDHLQVVGEYYDRILRSPGKVKKSKKRTKK